MVEIYEGDNLCVKLVCLRRVSLPFRRSSTYIIEAHQGWSSDLYLGVPLILCGSEWLAQRILIFGGLVALGIEEWGGWFYPSLMVGSGSRLMDAYPERHDLCAGAYSPFAVGLTYVLDTASDGDVSSRVQMLQRYPCLTASDDAMIEPLEVGMTTFAPRDFLLGLEAQAHLGEVGCQIVHARLFGELTREDDLIRRGELGHKCLAVEDLVLRDDGDVVLEVVGRPVGCVDKVLTLEGCRSKSNHSLRRGGKAFVPYFVAVLRP